LTRLLADPVLAYAAVFGILATLLFISLLILRRVDVAAFRQEGEEAPLVERAALASEA
jgi:hypothetical protein